MRRPLGQSNVQPAIVGFVDVRQTINLRQIWEFIVERPSLLFGGRRGYRRIATKYIGGGEPGAQSRLIDIGKPEELGAMVADVGNINGEIVCDGSLYTQRPGSNVR